MAQGQSFVQDMELKLFLKIIKNFGDFFVTFKSLYKLNRAGK